MTSRRDFLKLLLLAAPIAAHLDIDKLLWIPGEKTIFIPSGKSLSASDILALELERILPYTKDLFNGDDIFYAFINSKKQISRAPNIQESMHIWTT